MNKAVDRAKDALRNRRDFELVHNEFQLATNPEAEIMLSLLRRHIQLLYDTYPLGADLINCDHSEQVKYCETWMVEMSDQLCKLGLIHHVYIPVPSPDEENMSLWEAVSRADFYLDGCIPD